jgi:hypothetical protein
VFSVRREKVGCVAYRDRLEESLAAGLENARGAGELTLHLRECALCREAVETARLATRLVREGQRPVRASEAFVTRVTAAIRAQEVPVRCSALWRPLELLASRVALAASLALLALSLYIVKYAPPYEPAAAGGTQTEIGAGLPERPALPANDDEILMSLADMTDGI